ncbi:MAG: NAD(P)/FAD-dependent oxidoreductase, partial [Spirochaetota bacterium]
MRSLFDVVIIGAGACGTAVARELSRFKCDIAILEKENDVAMGATKANSGIVHGGFAESHSTLKGRLCYQGRSRFAALQEQLNFGFRKTGSLVIDFDEDISALQKLYDNGIRNGLTDLSIIGYEEIMDLDGAINPDVTWALY